MQRVVASDGRARICVVGRVGHDELLEHPSAAGRADAAVEREDRALQVAVAVQVLLVHPGGRAGGVVHGRGEHVLLALVPRRTRGHHAAGLPEVLGVHQELLAPGDLGSSPRIDEYRLANLEPLVQVPEEPSIRQVRAVAVHRVAVVHVAEVVDVMAAEGVVQAAEVLVAVVEGPARWDPVFPAPP